MFMGVLINHRRTGAGAGGGGGCSPGKRRGEVWQKCEKDANVQKGKKFCSWLKCEFKIERYIVVSRPMYENFHRT